MFSLFPYCRVHVEQSSDARGLDLVFRSIQSEDEGEYSCEAIIDGQMEQQFFYLKVIGKCILSLIPKCNEKIAAFTQKVSFCDL